MKLYNEYLLREADLLVICPTRQRPHLMHQFMHSFYHTIRGNTGLLFLLDDDDPDVFEYMHKHLKYEAFAVAERSTVTAYINKAYAHMCTKRYYSVTNDDFIYQTVNWDRRLMNLATDGIAYGDDKMNGRIIPTTSVIDGKILRALGWLQMPLLNHLYGDIVWKVIGEKLGILKYDPDVIIEHMHFLKNKSIKKDSIYEHTNSKEMYEKDDKAFHVWFDNYFTSDCLKILTELKREKKAYEH